MAAITLLTDNARKYLLDGTVSLVSDTINVALLSSAYGPRPAAPAWANSTSYAVGFIVVIAGRYYECITAGYSSGSLPVFTVVVGGTTTDNTVTWYCWGYMPPPAQAIFGEVSAYEISGSGYTAGGVSMTAKAITTAARTTSFSAAAVTWTNATFTSRYAAIYKLGTANAVVNPLIAVVLLDVTNIDVPVPTTATFTLVWPLPGVFSFSWR